MFAFVIKGLAFLRFEARNVHTMRYLRYSWEVMSAFVEACVEVLVKIVLLPLLLLVGVLCSWALPWVKQLWEWEKDRKKAFEDEVAREVARKLKEQEEGGGNQAMVVVTLN